MNVISLAFNALGRKPQCVLHRVRSVAPTCETSSNFRPNNYSNSYPETHLASSVAWRGMLVTACASRGVLVARWLAARVGGARRGCVWRGVSWYGEVLCAVKCDAMSYGMAHCGTCTSFSSCHSSLSLNVLSMFLSCQLI